MASVHRSFEIERSTYIENTVALPSDVIVYTLMPHLKLKDALSLSLVGKKICGIVSQAAPYWQKKLQKIIPFLGQQKTSSSSQQEYAEAASAFFALYVAPLRACDWSRPVCQEYKFKGQIFTFSFVMPQIRFHDDGQTLTVSMEEMPRSKPFHILHWKGPQTQPSTMSAFKTRLSKSIHKWIARTGSIEREVLVQRLQRAPLMQSMRCKYPLYQIDVSALNTMQLALALFLYEQAAVH